jgi:hypothetical protein
MKDLLSRRKPLTLYISVHQKYIAEYGGDPQVILDILFESGFKVSHLVVDSMEFSFKNIMNTNGPQEKAFHFDPPAGKHELNMLFKQLPDKYMDYHIFLARS